MMTYIYEHVRPVILVGFAIFSALVWFAPTTGSGAPTPYLTVSFLDVGQGDAIFIETPDGIQVLIDGGPDSAVLRELGDAMSLWDRDIDMVVGTHPDKDHIGGLISVLERYEVASVLRTENEGNSEAAGLYRELVANEGAEVLYARRGQEFQLGASTTLSVLFPDINPSEMESNTSSIILQLRYGDIEFMLTGDAPKSIEEYLVLRDGEHLESEVLKVGHHGSRTSTSELFLAEVAPEYAVISAGADNSYGHPHVEVTDALFNADVETFSTADSGTVIFQSEGTTVWVE